MYSVDLSGYEFFCRSKNHVDFFAECDQPVGKFKYGSMVLNRYASPDQLSNYNRIVYWGDFTTSFPYGRREYFNLKAATFFPYSKQLIKMGITKRPIQRQVIRRWEAMYLPQRPDKIYYSIGQNFQTMTRSVFHSLDQTKKNKYRQFCSILARDSASVQNLSELFDEWSPRPTVRQICDVAFLVSKKHEKPPAIHTRPTVGVYFRRSKIDNVTELLDAIARVANIVFFPDWIAKGLDFEESFQTNMARLRQCHFVVSDTYHFIINALREGCPVVGLGNAQTEQVNTISDFKKKVLFSDVGLPDYYLELARDKLDRLEIEKTLHLLGTPSHEYWASYRVDRDLNSRQIEEALAVEA